jgi:hypothetical protein
MNNGQWNDKTKEIADNGAKRPGKDKRHPKKYRVDMFVR